jgi:GTP-sensing transcriptional pleiotropic repressor CodY
MSLLESFRELSRVLREQQESKDLKPVAEVLSLLLDAGITVQDRRGAEQVRVARQAYGASSRRGRTAVLEVVAEVPVYAGLDQVGTLAIERQAPLDEEEQVLAEYGATILGLLMHARREGQEAETARRGASVRIALDALSYSEQAAAKRLFEELDGPQGLVVTSHIADQMGITRSVIVNALRKLESAGVIETRSLGMKGTFIRVLNPLLPDAFRELRL